MIAKFLSLVTLLAANIAFAQFHKGVTFEAYVVGPDGKPDSSTEFSAPARVVSPEGCLLLEEFFPN
jgi:hypothetical protein